MKRRSLIFRSICALFGLSATRLQAESAVEAAQAVCKPPQMLKWTVWFRNDTQMTVEAVAVTRLPVNVFSTDALTGDRVEEMSNFLIFTDENGDAVGHANLRDVMAYGCAYPPQKVGKDWLIKHATVHAPPNQALNFTS